MFEEFNKEIEKVLKTFFVIDVPFSLKKGLNKTLSEIICIWKMYSM
jgi:hypothetical protein